MAVTSRNGCLWGSSYPAGPVTYRGGCNFAAGKPDAFRHGWDATQNILTLQYNSSPMSSQRVDATVTMAFRS